MIQFDFRTALEIRQELEEGGGGTTLDTLYHMVWAKVSLDGRQSLRGQHSCNDCVDGQTDIPAKAGSADH